jgi:hypothetical protein
VIEMANQTLEGLKQMLHIGGKGAFRRTPTIEKYVELPAEHMRDLRVVPDRSNLLTLMQHDASVAEVGVDEGHFSEEILSVTTPKKLHLIDLWGKARFNEDKMHAVKARFAVEIETGQVTIRRGLSCDVLNTFDDGYFDWVYIDTTHGYEDTCRELAISRIKVRTGGMIAGHDYTVGNFERAAAYGVIRAVHEFCIEHRWEMIYLTHEPSRFLSFVLREMNPA